SNRHFYDNQLIVFPASDDDPERFGIAFHKVDGHYHGRTNVLEAQEVADAAIAHMRNSPELSLGVVAMNKPQAELIQLEIDRLVARDEDAAAFMIRWEGEIERFFVKNLETVQGDERDVILISTVYG